MSIVTKIHPIEISQIWDSAISFANATKEHSGYPALGKLETSAYPLDVPGNGIEIKISTPSLAGKKVKDSDGNTIKDFSGFTVILHRYTLDGDEHNIWWYPLVVVYAKTRKASGGRYDQFYLPGAIRKLSTPPTPADFPELMDFIDLFRD